jgi:DNA-binding CsgD family transcriptional regulator
MTDPANVREHPPVQREAPGQAAAWTSDPSRAAAFRAIAVLAAGPAPYEDVIEESARILAELFQAGCFIELLSPDSTSVYPLGLHHSDPDADRRLQELLGVAIEPTEAFAAPVMRTGQPLLIPQVGPEDIEKMAPEWAPFVQSFGSPSLLMVRMDGPTGRLGLVGIGQTPRGTILGPDDLEFVADVAGVLGLRVESAFLLELNQQLAGRDDVDAHTSPRDEAPAPPDPARAAAAGLTGREREVLALLARGHTNKEIGEHLFLSVRTVEWHRARLQWKLDVSSRAELQRAAKETGLA